MQNVERFEKFIISQKGLLIRDDKALIMEMTKYPGKWDLPGGRIDLQEDAKLAFVREIQEELGMMEFDNLGVAHFDIWYLSDGLPVCGIVNLIKNNDHDIEISAEHSQCAWINEDEIEDYAYLWPAMATMIKNGFLKYRLLNKMYEE